jgi:GTP 3',8-cyclase
MLQDTFGRTVNYLRLSVTDRCDFRCVYCMNEDVIFQSRRHVLSLEELYTVAKAFCELGVRKIRITGGEPLLRKNLLSLIEQLAALPQCPELCLTTNGSQLARWAPTLKAAGIHRINISLDTLQPQRFREFTRTGELGPVLDGIEATLAAGFQHTKLNSVILQHRNHDEVCDLVSFSIKKNLDISFIEEMPLGEVTDHARMSHYYPNQRIKQDLAAQFALHPSTHQSGGPARYYHVEGSPIRVGFISPHSANFCATCNRVRVTAEGRLLLCLGQEHSVDLRQLLREQNCDADTLKQHLIKAMEIKPKGHEFGASTQPQVVRFMHVTGG